MTLLCQCSILILEKHKLIYWYSINIQRSLLLNEIRVTSDIYVASFKCSFKTYNYNFVDTKKTSVERVREKKIYKSFKTPEPRPIFNFLILKLFCL